MNPHVILETQDMPPEVGQQFPRRPLPLRATPVAEECDCMVVAHFSSYVWLVPSTPRFSRSAVRWLR